ncbi:helix-turn-helix domain-containing protein [Erythrobacter sp. NE805]|uniref:helix-turn-helix domain-containing protein n=1 Tax=Erythrobacter sp. NE805 TaxID=3389875 RepID=UPI00396B4436
MDSETPTSADAAQDAPVAGPSERLRAAREALHLDLPHIAADTRIPLRHLQAIEDGQFEALPSRTYAIGFARTYAKAVGLDPAQITDLVRAELADGSTRRTVPASAMEPGDPARLPSSGLAWAAAAAVLILAIGAFAFYRTHFGAGAEPGSLLPPEPTASAAAPVAAAPAPAPSGPVVLTATEDGIWVRLYEEGGERLAERTLRQGETLEVPPAARDPRINTGRPDALAVTIGGQPVAKLSERPETITGLPVSAAALLARGTPAATSATPVAAETVPTRRRVPRRPAMQGAVESAEPAATEPAPAAPAGEPRAPGTR